MTAITIPNREQGALTNVAQGAVIGAILTALSYVVALQANWVESIDLLEAFAVFTSYVCTYLCVFERRLNYPIGAMSTAAYCVLFWRFNLNASMVINAFLSVYLLYGWIRWRADDDTRPVTRMSAKDWALTLITTAVGYIIVVTLSNIFDGTLVWTDAAILVGTLAAQFTLDNKFLATWSIWIVVNVFAIYTYATSGLALVSLQYVVFLLNAMWAWRVWLLSMRRSADQSLQLISTSQTDSLNN